MLQCLAKSKQSSIVIGHVEEEKHIPVIGSQLLVALVLVGRKIYCAHPNFTVDMDLDRADARAEGGSRIKSWRKYPQTVLGPPLQC